MHPKDTGLLSCLESRHNMCRIVANRFCRVNEKDPVHKNRVIKFIRFLLARWNPISSGEQRKSTAQYSRLPDGGRVQQCDRCGHHRCQAETRRRQWSLRPRNGARARWRCRRRFRYLKVQRFPAPERWPRQLLRNHPSRQ